MPDEAPVLLLKASVKAEACRRLADAAENEYRKALWIDEHTNGINSRRKPQTSYNGKNHKHD